MVLSYLAEYVGDMKDKLEILYEDNHVIVVVKPYNILSQSDNTKDIDMLSIIKRYLKDKYHKPGNVYLGLVHRLDRPTSGIMVFAKTSKAAKRLSEELKNNIFHKKYLAVINGNLIKRNGSLEDYLLKDENNSSVISDEKSGKYAKLNYKVISYKNNLSLVEIELITGRHHQIRVQFASRGFPLYGDQRYGIEDKHQLALYAYYLEFIHPISKEKLVFKKYPHGDIWNCFKEELC